MKKTLSTKRLTKRKTNKDILLLKNFSAEVESSKDVLQVVQEKLLLDSQSVWHGAEILYVVESLKRGKVTLDQAAQAKTNGKVKTPKSKSYLIILKRKDTGINMLILTLKDGDLELKNNCEPKFLRGIDFGSEDNEILLSFDSGDLNIFLTSQTDRDEAVWVIFQICKCIIGNDVSLGYSIDIEAISFKTTTNSTLTRFPVLNKLISAKNIQTGDVFSDEEAEAEHLLDELNWSAGSNGLISQQADLQLLLSAQSDVLKTEIIDFLLQWEEMDSIHPINAVSSQQQQQQQQHSIGGGGLGAHLNLATIKHNIADLKKNIASKVPPNPFAMHAAAAKEANNVTGSPSSSAAGGGAGGGSMVVTGVRDTREVLNALELVDAELEAVDQWLGEQIERLSEIKVNLSMIEDESGALETSWKNLNNVQEIIHYIVKGYSVDNRHQELLRQLPEQYFGGVLKATSLQSLPGLVHPLVEALVALRKALDLKSTLNSSNVTRLMRESQGESVNELESSTGGAAATISPAQWKQLQAIAAISTQRVKLSELSEMFCKNFGEFSLGVYDSILKHKALSDPASPTTIAIKQFAFQSLVDEFVLERFEYVIHDRKIDFSPLKTPLKMATQKNQFLNAVKSYHAAVSKFSPLLDIFIELAPQFSRPICESYVKSTQERLYIPLAKTLFKDLQNIVLSGNKSNKITLASCSNFHFESHKKTNTGGTGVGGMPDANIVRFRHDAHSAKSTAAAKSGGAISSWMALRVALIILAPVFETEERFMKVLFHNTRHFVEQGGHKVVTLAGESAHTFGTSKLASLLQTMFDPVVTRFETHILHCIGVIHAGAAPSTSAAASNSSSGSSGSGDQVDGIEAIAMLTILHEFSLMYVAISPYLFDSVGAPMEKRATISFDESNENIPTVDSAAAAPSHPQSYYLIQVLDTLRNALLARIHQFVNEQIVWINAQKYDPKSPAVLVPFAKFPTLIVQVMEMTNGMQFEHVDDLLHKLAKELFSWLTLTSKQSEKYCDKIKITNFTFFEKSVGPMNIGILENFVTFATQQKNEALARYVNWMVSYEFKALAALAVRMDGVGSRVNEEELSLYIRRKDVLDVVKEVENVKVLEANIVTLRKRLEKHFLCESYMELNLVPKGWQQIKNRVVSILSRLEDAASASYQLSLDVGPKVVQDLFDKHSNNTMVL